MLKSLFYGAGSAWAHLSKHHPVGRNIYEDDWDICIVLDSARVDTLRERWPSGVAVESFDSAWSRGSISTEWMSQTFRPAYRDPIADTTLVTANPHSATVFDERSILTNGREISVPYPETPAVEKDAFNEVYELWRTHAVAQNAVPPDVMADATIQAHREHEGRVVAHWLQPHEPFIAPNSPITSGSPTSANVWRAAMNGSLDGEKIVESYERTLDLALFELAHVLECVDARVLVTADHGNAFGEWGVWGHPFGWPQPAVRKVPWVTMQAHKRQDYNPHDVLASSEEPSDNTDVSEQLAALGYR